MAVSDAKTNCGTRRSALLVAALCAVASSSAGAQKTPRYQADIRWTSYGIPHVKANDWGSLGYGFAYATATDAVCTIARDVVMVNGELSRHFGAAEGNRESDVFHRAVLDAATVKSYGTRQTVNSNRFDAGYVAGYNRFLRDHRGDLPKECANSAWVRPLTSADLTRLIIGVGIRYGLGRYQKEMANAAPPGQKVGDLSTDFDMPDGIGSNAVAMGKAVTASGRGLLLGNPHYPWQGSSRFHMIHTTIPGELDVMGVSLYTTSRVAIGFNKDVAWSHTVSTGMRSTLYALDLNPADATQYKFGDTWRSMTPVTVQVPVKEDGGAVSAEAKTVYLTHYGPVVVSDQLPWTAARAYAIRDVNLTNDRNAITYDALNKARSIDDVEAAISLQGVSWTNTIAADRNGTAFYADLSVVPNVDAALIDRCRVKPAGVPAQVIVLNGTDPTCEWKTDARASVVGAMPAQSMPRLRRDDVVSNANDSYWLSNPLLPLEGFSPIIGAERTARSLRTRAGISFIEEALKSGAKATPETLEKMLFSHRNYGAELLLDDLLTLCSASVEPVVLSTGAVDITPSCRALSQWNRKETVDSRGGHVWREFWRLAARIPGLYRVPFNAADAANTPRGLAVEQPGVREGLRRALAQTQQRLAQFGIPLDATLGSIQYEMRNGERIPIPGGDGATGMWSVITTELKKDGYTPIVHGNSYIQVVGWNADGTVDPHGILTYSQSDNPASPYYADQTRLYSQGQWLHLPFYEKDILADKNLRTLRLRQ
ncbi:MAG: penicillin acylase family protein [Gemmatimonadaceae bacterium]|nr:penicillin acylase family protein [Gemmatimonadaceae bacterium]